MEKNNGSEEDRDVESSLMEALYLAEGKQGLITLKNFTSEELDALWQHMSKHVEFNWNVGNGRKFKNKPKDVLIMIFAVLKKGKAWNIVVQFLEYLTQS